MNDTEIQEKAKEIATKYNAMKYIGLGNANAKKYSLIEWREELDRLLTPIDKYYHRTTPVKVSNCTSQNCQKCDAFG